MKITISIDLANILKKPVTEVTDEELLKATDKLPKQTVVLPKDETMMEPGQNAEPLVYTVKKGDTLKSISEKFGVSYGELSNHVLNKTGSTSIIGGDKIEIPRHFIDLSRA